MQEVWYIRGLVYNKDKLYQTWSSKLILSCPSIHSLYTIGFHYPFSSIRCLSKHCSSSSICLMNSSVVLHCVVITWYVSLGSTWGVPYLNSLLCNIVCCTSSTVSSGPNMYLQVPPEIAVASQEPSEVITYFLVWLLDPSRYIWDKTNGYLSFAVLSRRGYHMLIDTSCSSLCLLFVFARACVRVGVCVQNLQN